MNNARNDKGFALLTVLLISLISMVLVSTLFFVLNAHTTMSGKDKRYLTELEVAKGASQFIMAALRDDSLTCNTGGTCSPDDPIDLHGAICDAMGRTLACNGLSARIISKTPFSQTGQPVGTLYAVEFISQSTSTPEKAEIEFIYKVY